jgi:hypothetical protein
LHNGLSLAVPEIAKGFKIKERCKMSSALDEFKKPIEHWAHAVIDEIPMDDLLILYMLLYAVGLPDRRRRFRDRLVS